MLHHWKVYIPPKWRHVEYQKWYHITKIIWIPHQYRTQRRHCSVPQEILWPHQYVSQWSYYCPIIPYSCLSFYQKSLLGWRKIPYRDHHSYSWNAQTYTSFWHTLLLAIINDTCVKYSMSPQSYKVVITCAHKIWGWTFLSRLIHARSPHMGRINDDVQSELATLAFKNR